MSNSFKKTCDDESVKIYERSMDAGTPYSKASTQVTIIHSSDISNTKSFYIHVRKFNPKLVRMTNLFEKKGTLEEICSKICEDENAVKIAKILGHIKGDDTIDQINEQIAPEINANRYGEPKGFVMEKIKKLKKNFKEMDEGDKAGMAFGGAMLGSVLALTVAVGVTENSAENQVKEKVSDKKEITVDKKKNEQPRSDTKYDAFDHLMKNKGGNSGL